MEAVVASTVAAAWGIARLSTSLVGPAVAGVVFECRIDRMLKKRLLSFFCSTTLVSVVLDSRSGRMNVEEGSVVVVECNVADVDDSALPFCVWLALSWFNFSKYRFEANSVM